MVKCLYCWEEISALASVCPRCHTNFAEARRQAKAERLARKEARAAGGGSLFGGFFSFLKGVLLVAVGVAAAIIFLGSGRDADKSSAASEVIADAPDETASGDQLALSDEAEVATEPAAAITSESERAAAESEADDSLIDNVATESAALRQTIRVADYPPDDPATPHVDESKGEFDVLYKRQQELARSAAEAER